MLLSLDKKRHVSELRRLGLNSTYVYIVAILCFVLGCLFGHANRPASVSLQDLEGSGSPKPSVLVTGGLGFIGSHVVQDLVEHGFNVLVYDDMSNGRNFNRDSAAVYLKDITVVNDFSYITAKVRTYTLRICTGTERRGTEHASTHLSQGGLCDPFSSSHFGHRKCSNARKVRAH